MTVCLHARPLAAAFGRGGRVEGRRGRDGRRQRRTQQRTIRSSGRTYTAPGPLFLHLRARTDARVGGRQRNASCCPLLITAPAYRLIDGHLSIPSPSTRLAITLHGRNSYLGPAPAFLLRLASSFTEWPGDRSDPSERARQ